MVAIHAGCMLAGLFAMAAGITVALSARKKRWWLSIHKTCGATGVLFVILGFAGAIYMVSRYTGTHFAVPHAYLGIVTILSALFTFTMGITQLKAGKKKARIRLTHRWSGRVTLVLMLVNILSGVSLAGIF